MIDLKLLLQGQGRGCEKGSFKQSYFEVRCQRGRIVASIIGVVNRLLDFAALYNLN